MSVISKSKANEILEQGGYLHWDSFCAKGCVSDMNDKFIGKLRYKTYRELSKCTEVKTEKTILGWVNKHFLKKDKEIKLKDFLPKLDNYSNEDLYICMNLIQKEIKKRHNEKE